jgi:hypothetical protein
MGKISDRMQLALDAAAKLQPSAHGAEMQMKRKHANAAPASESLADVGDGKVLPANYRNLYNQMKARDPAKAREFWNKWAYDPRPKPVDPFELEKKALAKLDEATKIVKPLKRRA